MGLRGCAQADLIFENCRVPKENVVIQPGNFVKLMEAFNLLNKADILQVNNRVNQASANTVREILSPRIIRFGARFNF